MNPIQWLGLAMSAALLLASGGCKDKAPPARASAVPEVVVRTVELRAVPLHTELPGRTTATMVAEVRPQVGGIIRSRPFTEGSTVKAGQVLYEIDPAPLQAEVQRAEGALASARASVAATRATAERYKALLPQKAISQQEYDNAAAAYEQAQASVKVQQAALNTARINLQYAQVRAPIAGRTSRSAVTPGALVSAAQATPLLTISQLDPIYVDIAQSSAEMLALRKALAAGKLDSTPDSQRVSLLLEDGSRYPHEGRIQLTEVTVDPNSGSVTLRARFPNPEGLLLPGMFVRAVVNEGSTPQGILVPQSAVARDRRGNPVVRVVGEGDKLELRPVVTPRTAGTDWLVTEGLKAGDRVVVEGNRELAAGTQVKVVAPREPAAPGASRPAAAASRAP